MYSEWSWASALLECDAWVDGVGECGASRGDEDSRFRGFAVRMDGVVGEKKGASSVLICGVGSAGDDVLRGSCVFLLIETEAWSCTCAARGV